MLLLSMLMLMLSVCNADPAQFDLIISSGKPFKMTKASMAVCGAKCTEDKKCKGFTYNSSERRCHWMEETCQESHLMYVNTNHPTGRSGNNVTKYQLLANLPVNQTCPQLSNASY